MLKLSKSVDMEAYSAAGRMGFRDSFSFCGCAFPEGGMPVMGDHPAIDPGR
ncbi:hypothetical protein [Nocardia sp. NPDC046763]|uniref:hypothetical protein n=1 Tax=Nocardia sp. NPDC046763 TaxID=3155256 RepID=UPI0033C4A336